jgi:hypothetical protein
MSQSGLKYDDVNFLIIRHQAMHGSTISAPSEATLYVGATLKVSQKAAVLGVAFQIQSGPGSAVGTNSIHVVRLGTSATASTWATDTLVTSLGASMANDVIDMTLASAMTLASLGVGAGIKSGAASQHKCIVIKNVVWRYRLLPADLGYEVLG